MSNYKKAEAIAGKYIAGLGISIIGCMVADAADVNIYIGSMTFCITYLQLCIYFENTVGRYNE